MLTVIGLLVTVIVALNIALFGALAIAFVAIAALRAVDAERANKHIPRWAMRWASSSQ